MLEFKLKNVTTPGYKPPATWEEFEGLERPARIVAARYFVRKAAIRLLDFGLRPDDVISAFDAVPEWVSHQLHKYKREQAELRKTWVCRVEECGHRGVKAEFFPSQEQTTFLLEKAMARCPKCGLCDAEEYVEQMPGVEPAPLGKIRKLDSEVCSDHTYEQDGLRCDKCGKLRPGTKGFQSDGAVSEEPCVCEGQPCPVCSGMGEDSVIENHRCERCRTVFCERCHGISSAQLSRAYGEVQRCKCQELTK